jgi:ABC-2 type transport system ATP-binding protein
MATIEACELTRTYGEKLALDRLSLTVEPGEIVGLLGPNGAGKTTTVKILTAMLPPTSGSARVAGCDVRADPLEVKRRIGFVPESGALYENLTANEYLEFVAHLHHLDPSGARQRISEMFELLGLLPDADRRMTGFSKGMKQKVLIAAALVHNPEVLFLDEPLNGIDANGAALIKELLKQLAASGKTILFCSHVLDVVERVCTRIVIVSGGRAVADGTAAELTARTRTPRLEEAFVKLTSGEGASDRADSFLRVVGRPG